MFLELTEYDKKINDLVRKIIHSENTHRIDFEKQGIKSNSEDRKTPIYHIIEGKEYTRIMKDGGSNWGFVVKEDNDKFKKGDILRAKSSKEPYLNHARGNIYDENLEVSWFGAE